MNQITLARKDKTDVFSRVHICKIRASFTALTYCKEKVYVFAKVSGECVSALSALGIICPTCAKAWMREQERLAR